MIAEVIMPSRAGAAAVRCGAPCRGLAREALLERPADALFEDVQRRKRLRLVEQDRVKVSRTRGAATEAPKPPCSMIVAAA